MPVTQLGVAKQIDQYKQQHLNIFFFDILNSMMKTLFSYLYGYRFLSFLLSVWLKPANEINVYILIT